MHKRGVGAKVSKPCIERTTSDSQADGNPLKGFNLQTDTTEVELVWVSADSIAKP